MPKHTAVHTHTHTRINMLQDEERHRGHMETDRQKMENNRCIQKIFFFHKGRLWSSERKPKPPYLYFPNIQLSFLHILSFASFRNSVTFFPPFIMTLCPSPHYRRKPWNSCVTLHKHTPPPVFFWPSGSISSHSCSQYRHVQVTFPT